MKKKWIFTLFVLITAFTAYYFYAPFKEQISPQPSVNEFIFGAVQTWNDHDYHLRNYDSIGLNGWHCYNTGDIGNIPGEPDRHTPRSWVSLTLDRLTSDISVYGDRVTEVLDSVHRHNNSSMIWSRPKIEWLAYGQRSDYQFEPAPLDRGLCNE